jgi:hypothetical protein
VTHTDLTVSDKRCEVSRCATEATDGKCLAIVAVQNNDTPLCHAVDFNANYRTEILQFSSQIYEYIYVFLHVASSEL